MFLHINKIQLVLDLIVFNIYSLCIHYNMQSLCLYRYVQPYSYTIESQIRFISDIYIYIYICLTMSIEIYHNNKREKYICLYNILYT